MNAESTALFTYTFGASRTQRTWQDRRTATWATLADLLTRHERGPKEGSSIVPAVFRGARRHKADADQIDLAILDADCGHTLAEIEAAVRARGWAAIVHSTHSHQTATTTAKASHWKKFSDARPAATPVEFLTEEKGYLPRVATGARLGAVNGDVITFEHAPCPKFRVVLRLARPWRAADYSDQTAANAAWKERIEALAGALGLSHDQSCTDTSRLFYLPRYPGDGRDPVARVIDGADCDIWALPGRAPDASTSGLFGAKRHGADAGDYTNSNTGEIIDLRQWAKSHGAQFEIVTALRARRPDVFVGHITEAVQHHIRCVNEDAHTTAGADRATIAVNASEANNKGFVVHCRHAHCTGHDRLFFVRRMLQHGWLKVEDLSEPDFLAASAAEASEDPAANEGADSEPPPDAAKVAADIVRLALLSRVAYDHCRESEAKRLRIRVSTLDAEVERLRKPSAARAAMGNDAGIITEDTVAIAFVQAHRADLRFCHHAGAWYRWDGCIWQREETKLAFSWARMTARRLAQDSGEDAAIMAAGRAAFVAAVERFAQADRAFAVTSAIWDTNPWLLGTPQGTVDLRTGEMRAPRQEDHITKRTAVSPTPTADCPLWLAFLDQVTQQDAGLIRFLKQWCGYCLTGDIREHALLFAYGDGGNGKGVFLNTVSWIMHDYARNAAMDSFVASQTDKHPTDLAMLRGARLVTASETEEGRQWAEARIKAMTGGDRITARFMRQDFFEYYPQFKLTIIGNHRPVLRNVDDAARRRINMAAFLYKPPVKDMQLEGKLQAEAPAILRWMIEGCLDWQQSGLIRPDVVKAATAKYFSEQDTVSHWIEDCCDLGKTQSDTLAGLFKSWSDYALANGEKPGTAKWFSQTLAKLGCEAVKNTPGAHGKRGFKGIGLKLVAAKDHTEPNYDDDEPNF